MSIVSNREKDKEMKNQKEMIIVTKKIEMLTEVELFIEKEKQKKEKDIVEIGMNIKVKNEKSHSKIESFNLLESFLEIKPEEKIFEEKFKRLNEKIK